jgi:hypothetical protein
MNPAAILAIAQALAPYAKELAPIGVKLMALWKQRGELTPEQIAELNAMNDLTEADYVRKAGGRE